MNGFERIHLHLTGLWTVDKTKILLVTIICPQPHSLGYILGKQKSFQNYVQYDQNMNENVQGQSVDFNKHYFCQKQTILH